MSSIISTKGKLTSVLSGSKGVDSKEACDRLIKVLTAHIELGELLDSMEEATSVTDVYEAITDYVADIKRKIADETIVCDSVFKMIKEDVQLERAYREVYK